MKKMNDQTIEKEINYLNQFLNIFQKENIQFSSKYIIARYEENLDWLEKFPFHKILVFNKGNINIEKFKSISLPNVGRESHTYLHYIIENYNNLPDVCVFMQGKIEDHIQNDLKNDYLYIKKMELEAYLFGLSQNFIYLKNLENVSSKWAYPNFNILTQDVLKNMFKVENPTKSIFSEWFLENIGEKYPNENLKIYGGGIFGIRKDLILSRPITYYQNILSYLNKENAPLEGHFMERSWKYVFYPGDDDKKIDKIFLKYFS